MQGLIKPATVKVVANPFDHGEAKIELGWFTKGAMQSPPIGGCAYGWRRLEVSTYVRPWPR
jgi:hypothetical protein